MDARLVKIKLDLRLNKLASHDYANIECNNKREAIKKAQLEWVRRQIHGMNLMKEGDEESKMRVDDLQILLKPEDLKLTDKGIFYQTEKLPDDYGWFKTVTVMGEKDGCTSQILDIHHIEEANVNDWLNDWSKSPSFEFRQCFYTFSGNTIKVYTNNEFSVSRITLIYYRLPKKYNLDECGESYDGTVSPSQDIEFKDDVAELIIDEAASILAADIENVNAYQVLTKRKEENN